MSTARGRVASRAHKAAREQMEAAVNTRLVHAGLSSHTHMHVGRWTEQLRNSKTICHHSENLMHDSIHSHPLTLRSALN